MGPAFSHCTTNIYGFGDSTAGPIWKFGLEPDQPPFGGPENVTNFPKGENLYNPIGYSSALQSVALWGLSKAAGPVCSYNVFNIIGYLMTSIIMFAFIYYLTRNGWIAWLSGYAVAFTPYIQSKIGGHPSYAYAGLLILSLWICLHIVKRPNVLGGILLSLTLAVCAYFDPYFILLAGTIVGPAVLIWAIFACIGYFKHPTKRQQNIKTLKIFILSGVLLLLLLLPLLFVRINEAQSISNHTQATRGSGYETAQQCSNMPLDYLLPDPTNIYFTKLFGDGYIQKNIESRHWCGFGESRVSISITLMTVVFAGLFALSWAMFTKRHYGLGKRFPYKPKFILSVLISVGICALLVGLPPKIRGLIMPSGIILHITDIWRVFAREYLVLNIVIVVLSAITLQYFRRNFFTSHRNIPKVIFFLIVLLLMAEYQINPRFDPPTFSYTRDVPSIYYTLKNDQSINAIAEYPLDRPGLESDALTYYLTMQTAHNKKLFNPAEPDNYSNPLDLSLKDLSDPQTIPLLRELGIDAVVIHGETLKNIKDRTSGLEIIGKNTPPVYGLKIVRNYGSNDIVLAKLLRGPTAKRALVIKKGFVINMPIMTSPVDTEYELLQDSQLEVQTLTKTKNMTAENTCFDIRMSAEGDRDSLEIFKNNSRVESMTITDKYQLVVIRSSPGDLIRLHTLKGHNIRINNLGCTL